ncbi:MAG: hypothetical protein M3O15_02250, partial [Acidobacteriota bacterium]|nr:hypothetical protein [Acidobacteriota bacterium]
VYRWNDWIHVRIAFSGEQAEIHIDDMAKAVLRVDELKRGTAAGGVGLSALDFAPAHFSNFSFARFGSIEPAGAATAAGPVAAAGEAAGPDSHPAAPLALRPHPHREAEPAPDGLIRSWWVSDAFRESALVGRHSLFPEDLAAHRWSLLPAEGSGLANLARIQGIELRKNTVFARKVIVSEKEQTKQLAFGFSDRVRVYLNGRLLYSGDDTQGSRDYRFLGSIGYFDALYLPFKAGANELLLAVSENQGGWGIQAKLENLAGLGFEE